MFQPWAMLVLPAAMFGMACGQRAGRHVLEGHPKMPIWSCDKESCTQEMKPLVLDANWRWMHNGHYSNCMKNNSWDPEICPDAAACAKSCHLEGVSLPDYKDKYGVKTDKQGVSLAFAATTKHGTNFGQRVFMMEDDKSYKMFKLKNRELSVSVDMNRVPCGLNAAVYFVEMEADGGMRRSKGANRAGAKYGTGYCDAQCPRDMKFVQGKANVKGWSAKHSTGHTGSCCTELDVWEANSRANAFAVHPCNITGFHQCEGKECDDMAQGVCDKEGCAFNPYRMGDQHFYGRHARFEVDSTRKMQVVTQFITADGTDSSDLVDIRRFYVQDGRVIPNSNSSIVGARGNSISEDFCTDSKRAFGESNDFQQRGGLKAMSDTLDRGMVLVLSLWDDFNSKMLWLDSSFPTDEDPKKPGVARGPCSESSGSPLHIRSKFPEADARFTDIRVGQIGTTFNKGNEVEQEIDARYGQNRLLSEAVHI